MEHKFYWLDRVAGKGKSSYPEAYGEGRRASRRGGRKSEFSGRGESERGLDHLHDAHQQHSLGDP